MPPTSFAVTLGGGSLQLGPPAAGHQHLPDVIFCESFLGCLDPYPGYSSGAFTRFFPEDIGLPLFGKESALTLVRATTSARP